MTWWEVDLLGVDLVGVDFVRVDLAGGHPNFKVIWLLVKGNLRVWHLLAVVKVSL